MSLFKKFANFTRQSNNSFPDRLEKFQESQDEYRRLWKEGKHGTRCCADCTYYYTSYPGRGSYYCLKHDFSYDEHEVENHNIQYKRTCPDFSGKTY